MYMRCIRLEWKANSLQHLKNRTKHYRNLHKKRTLQVTSEAGFTYKRFDTHQPVGQLRITPEKFTHRIPVIKVQEPQTNPLSTGSIRELPYSNIGINLSPRVSIMTIRRVFSTLLLKKINQNDK